jgi:hypothetical protein
MQNLVNPEIKVVIINGFGGSGKDTFVKICASLLGSTSVLNVSSVDPAKAILREKHGWDGVDKSENWRSLLVQIKQEQIADGDIPTNYVVERVRNSIAKLVFIHIREAIEIGKCITRLEALGISTTRDNLRILLIKRPNIEVPNNTADKSVEEFEGYTDTIDNSMGLKELAIIALNFLKNWNITSRYK